MLPLNEQTVEIESSTSEKAGNVTIPALHPSRKESIEFVLYQAPPIDLSDRGSYEEWMERMRFIKADLHKLLQLPYDKFWCQAVFDEKLHRCLDAYLQQAPRSFDSLQDLPQEGLVIHEQIHRLVFMTYLRMATCKESKENFIVPKVFGDILYENFIFDIPKMMDMCVLYGKDNGPLLSKMIGNIFKNQPKYGNDLKETLPAISQVFHNICEKCGVGNEHSNEMSPQKINTASKNSDPLVTMTTEDFADVMYYLCDTSTTLSAFLDVYPEACPAFFMSTFPQRIAVFFDNVVPALEKNLKARQKLTSSHIKAALKRRLQLSRKHLIKSFHQIVQICCMQPVLENPDPIKTQNNVEAYLAVFSNIQGERRFLADYESQYPFGDDLDIISQAPCMIDETRIQFIQDGINSAFATFGKRKKPKGAKNAGGRESPDGSAGSNEEGAMGGAIGGGAIGGAMGGDIGGALGGRMSSMNDVIAQRELDEVAHASFAGDGACVPKITGVELDSLITSIKDLLPELGEGFIQACLEEFHYNQERVINSVLEDNLPPPLCDMDRSLVRTKTEEAVDLLSQRRCVFDYDEFDVFNRDTIDMSRVILGKKEKLTVGKSVFDDKTELSALKPLYDRYGSGVMGESVYEPDLYDDEYDDTYDTGIIGPGDDDSADEMTSRRAFTTPRILEKKPESQRSSQISDESSEEEVKKDEFVVNPALIRARAEERAQWKAQRNANKRGQGPRPQGQPSQSQGQRDPEGQGHKKYDVKGKPKGQGQDANVVRNRNFKDKHKSSLGNHNRKAMADKKRMKGMAP